MIMPNYDYIIVGAGIFGTTFAYLAKKINKRCLVIDRRKHLGGNTYCSEIEGINIHEYGPHIFHTDNKKIWDFINRFTSFNNYINTPIANYKGEIYNLPFNMNTFNRMWGTVSPIEAKQKIAEQRLKAGISNPKNLEEQAISLIGTDIYKKLVKGYTEKQWGESAKNLPSFIIKRLPVRFTYNNNYYSDSYQGIPEGTYNKIINNMLEGIDIRLDTDFLLNKDILKNQSKKVVFTGMLDEFFNYCFGSLEYRSLRFEHEIMDTDNFQGNAVVNFTDRETPYTRIIEHKHFEFGEQKKTVITKEYPMKWKIGDEPYYPINNERNINLFKKYKELTKKEPDFIFGGRLADYRYYDMDDAIEKAIEISETELKYNFDVI
jgi:UDP-galactopyranose mutase